jgi:diketogulonate reductase-like aldo/keto reductase
MNIGTNNLISMLLFTMNSGYKIPAVGLGTYQIKQSDEVDISISTAYAAGYRHIDSAVIYRNESAIGEALKKFKIPRKEMFITTKISSNKMKYEDAKKCIDNSLKNFQTDYIDLYLIHWPGAKSIEDRIGVWRALEEGVESGKIRSIGVSNFLTIHLKTIIKNCKIKPAINQIEIHPLFIDWETIQFCENEGILIEAYSTFARMDPKLIENKILIGIADKYNKKPTQVLVRWAVQHGWVVLPKSTHEEIIHENIDVDDFFLSDDDLKTLDSLNSNYKVAWDPKKIDF